MFLTENHQRMSNKIATKIKVMLLLCNLQISLKILSGIFSNMFVCLIIRFD